MTVSNTNRTIVRAVAALLAAGALAGGAGRLAAADADLDGLEDIVLDLGGRPLRPPRAGRPAPAECDSAAVAASPADLWALARDRVNAALRA